MTRLSVSAVLVAMAGLLTAQTAKAVDSPAPPVPSEAVAARTQIAANELASADPNVIFRFDPFLVKLVSVTPAEIKAGYLYNHYNQQLGRRVWSRAVEGGGFQYAMAPGSTQPAWALDLRATQQQLRQELIARAPELAKMIDVRGAVAHVRLKNDETWELVKMTTIGNVFDLETGRRWEWHGARRVAVVHTGGYEWQFVDGKPLPVTYEILSYANCQ
jgi:hypothetical protein